MSTSLVLKPWIRFFSSSFLGTIRFCVSPEQQELTSSWLLRLIAVSVRNGVNYGLRIHGVDSVGRCRVHRIARLVVD